MSKYIYNCSLQRLPRHSLRLKAHARYDQLPPAVDLRGRFKTVYDQGQLGSCTANALCALARFRNEELSASRLFLYYNERNMEGTASTDSGAMLSDGVRALQQIGVCEEADWPYDIARFAEKPPQPCYQLAEQNRFTKSFNIDNTDIEQVKHELFNGNPFVIGIAVYESFESPEVARTGVVPMPQPHEKLLGGHAVLVTSYSDIQQRVTCLNSWSADWGDCGFFHLPYDFLTNPDLTSDAWTVDI